MGLVRVAERASEIGASAVQIFSDNPTAWRRRAETPPEAAPFRHRLGELDIGPVAIHAAYLVNLAGPDDVLFGRSVEMVRHELEHAPEYGARFVNIHVGSHRGAGRETGIRRLAEGLGLALARVPAGPDAPLVVLENSAGGGFAVGTTVEDLADIVDACAAIGVDTTRLGFCLDTAHLWGYGYAIGDPEGVDDLLARVDALLGRGRVAMVHLNDSKAERGSRYDRHAHLGAGRIGIGGLHRFLTHPALAGLPHYLETPGMDEGYDALNVRNALRIAAGLAPEPVPAEALRSRGSGSLTAPE